MNIKINQLNDLKQLSYISVINKLVSITLKMDLYRAIGQKKYTISTLSELLDCHPDRLKRILELLVYVGILNYENEMYSNSSVTNKYLCGSYIDGQKSNLWFYFLEEDKIISSVLRNESNLGCQYKEEVHDFLERMDSSSRYSAYWLCKKLKPSGAKCLLDVGCGSGVFSFIMCDYNTELQADCIDEQHDVITIINEKIKQEKLENRVSAKICNIKHEDFTAENKYDYILMSNVLHYMSLDEIERTLQLGYDALRNHGKLIIGDVFPIKDDIETLCYSLMWMQYEGIQVLEKDTILNVLSNNKYVKIDTFKIEGTPTSFIIAEK